MWLVQSMSHCGGGAVLESIELNWRGVVQFDVEGLLQLVQGTFEGETPFEVFNLARFQKPSLVQELCLCDWQDRERLLSPRGTGANVEGHHESVDEQFVEIRYRLTLVRFALAVR